MASRLEWVVTPEQGWMPGYQKWASSLIDMVEAAMLARREEIELWLKNNHPWTNRTGIAEEGLFADVIRDGTFIIVVMGHDAITWYSRFLEKYMQGGRFSVLLPALDYWSVILADDVRKMFR